ncbi:MAG: M23 family metallopeptidase, partial [Hyphomicrobiales bacterium]
AKLATELAELSVRQDQYASRHARVAAVIDNARRMGIQVAAVSAPMPMIKPGSTPILADSGISLTGDESAVGGENEPEDNGVLKMPNTFEEFEQESSLEDPFQQIERYEADLKTMEQINAVSIHAVATAITKEHSAYRDALAELPIKLKLPAKVSAIGGPFIPVEFDEAAISATSKRIDRQLEDISRLRKISASLPIAVPLKNAVRSSSFGRRIDPFRKRAAFHAGVDFRARTGTSVFATADGQILRAGRAGGYGKLVEIRHAHGLTTRFGHLSKISVKAGQSVKRGDVIGKVGSTGRSTGPHLHYEVRNRGQAKNPQPFMDAGKHLPKL